MALSNPLARRLRSGLMGEGRQRIVTSGEVDNLVRGLYMSVLNRKPEIEGLTSAKTIIRSMGIEKGVAFVTKALLDSEESHRRLIPRFVTKLEMRDTRSFSHAFSIGSRCVTAHLMRKADMRKASGPFDWLFCDLVVVSKCIEDDFSTFLDRSQYEKMNPDEPHSCEHVYFRKHFGVKSMFSHHDPTTDVGYSYLQRCVERFRQGLASSSGALFLSITDDAYDFEGRLERLRVALTEVSSNHRIVMVKVVPPKGGDVFRLVQTIEAADCHTYEYVPYGKMGGLKFSEEFDDQVICALFEGYSNGVEATT